MNDKERPKCRHCNAEMRKWRTPENSTWEAPFLWVCFNDECPYFVRGWAHMMKTQEVKASYRQSLDPVSGAAGPLPCWSNEAHKDNIIED
jgi:hypothetical protein